MRTLLALVLSPLAASVALAIAAPALMLAGVDETPARRFWDNFPAIVLVGTGIAYVVTFFAAPLTKFAMWTRDRSGLRDYTLAGVALGAAMPVVLIMLEGFSARARDTIGLAVLGACAGAATAAAFWWIAVRGRDASPVVDE